MRIPGRQWLILMLIATPLTVFLLVWPASLNIGEQFVSWIPTLLALAISIALVLGLFQLVQTRTGERTTLRLGILTTVTLLLGVAVSVLIVLPDALNTLQQVQVAVAKMEGLTRNLPAPDQMTLADFDGLQADLTDLTGGLEQAKVYARFLGPFSGLNSDLGFALAALDVVYEFALGIEDMMTGARPIFVSTVVDDANRPASFQSLSPQIIAGLLDTSQENFISAGNHLAVAQTRIDDLDLGTVSPTMLLRIDQLIDYHGQIQEANQLLSEGAALLTSALGLSEKKQYVVLFQNSDELRPSGGYISTYGEFSVQDGQFVDFAYYPSTTTNPAPPSTELADELIIPDWWIEYDEPIYAAWDGSWYADFPATAEMSLWYYENGGNPLSSVDGVIAVDLVAFEMILEALGGVDVPRWELITVETFRELVYEVRSTGQDAQLHKRFLADIYEQILNDLLRITTEEQIKPELLTTILRALQEKHIMVYFVDDQLNTAVNMLGWAGAQTPGTDHDYLMVVDTNLTSKSSRSVIRQLDYEVEIQPDGSLQSDLTINYDFPLEMALLDPAVGPIHGTLEYNNLFQVFAPVDTELVTVDHLQWDLEIIADDKQTDFITFATIPYDGSEHFHFSYDTPPLVEEFGPYHRYRLLLQKQAGRMEDAVHVQVTLPPGAEVVSISPRLSDQDQPAVPVVEFDMLLNTDQWVEIIYTVNG